MERYRARSNTPRPLLKAIMTLDPENIRPAVTGGPKISTVKLYVKIIKSDITRRAQQAGWSLDIVHHYVARTILKNPLSAEEAADFEECGCKLKEVAGKAGGTKEEVDAYVNKEMRRAVEDIFNSRSNDQTKVLLVFASGDKHHNPVLLELTARYKGKLFIVRYFPGVIHPESLDAAHASYNYFHVMDQGLNDHNIFDFKYNYDKGSTCFIRGEHKPCQDKFPRSTRFELSFNHGGLSSQSCKGCASISPPKSSTPILSTMKSVGSSAYSNRNKRVFVQTSSSASPGNTTSTSSADTSVGFCPPNQMTLLQGADIRRPAVRGSSGPNLQQKFDIQDESHLQIHSNTIFPRLGATDVLAKMAPKATVPSYLLSTPNDDTPEPTPIAIEKILHYETYNDEYLNIQITGPIHNEWDKPTVINYFFQDLFYDSRGKIGG
ncbi:hypothetical protein KFL_001970030 [Klebsormidium nitens]|uniref:Uncharacterized protein n=1 Tax=Klebsormidium nitens TaxID=105231 RepID=A0A1Y1I3S7_KLENI|nr:hypothetical protein KFL_001970030 [Klebsormidium nitens]|eukprot:GAQ84602.1 hypothetical protein KFL_001970030 [Klebsormidium nitens]